MSQDDLSLPPMSEALQRLFEEERGAPARLPPRARARVAEHLGVTLGIPLLPAGAAGATSAAAAGAAHAGSVLATLGKPLALALFAAGVAVGTGTHALVVASRAPAHSSPEAAATSQAQAPAKPPEAPAAATPPAAAPSATPPVNAPAPARDSARPEPAAPAAPAAAASRDNALAAERASLEQARTALVRGNADEAIVTLQAHLRKHPRGDLREEADALLAMALASAGRVDEAKAAAARFHGAHPDALLGPAVDRAVREAKPR